MRVYVAVARPQRQAVIELDLPEGSVVADALRAPAVQAMLGEKDARQLALGIWSRRCSENTVLREGDRVEVYRPLQADPKAMRRERARLKPSTRSRSRP